MTRQLLIIWLVWLVMPIVIPPGPAQAAEIYRNWNRIRENQRQREGNTRERRMQGNQEGQQEIHGAVNESDCHRMERNFRRQGRRVRLVDVRRTNNPGAVLRFMCVFQGEDASAGWFDEKRY
jgi:hypothetical protein